MDAKKPTKQKAIFFDRDGTLMKDTGYCSRPAEVELLKGVRIWLPRLKDAGFRLIIVTNQSGIGRGYFNEEDFWAVQEELQKQLGDCRIDATYFCADTPQQESERRKPNPGMLRDAASDLGIDLTQSYMVGDKISDAEAGLRAGVKAAILLKTEPAEELRKSGTVLVAKDFGEVAKLILGSGVIVTELLGECP